MQSQSRTFVMRFGGARSIAIQTVGFSYLRKTCGRRPTIAFFRSGAFSSARGCSTKISKELGQENECNDERRNMARGANIDERTEGSLHTRVCGDDGDTRDAGEEVKSADGKLDKKFVKQLSILTGSQLVLNLGFAQMVPIMPLFAAQMGGHLGATGVGMILSAPSLATMLLNFPLGRLCDTVGRKPLMLCGTAMTAAGTAMTGFAGSLATVLPCRLLVGAGSSASMTASSAYMADLSDRAPQHRAKIMGINQAVVGSMWVIGPAFGGFLAESYGLQNSFLIAGTGAMLCSLGYSQLPETLNRGNVVESTTQNDVGGPESFSVRRSVASWWRTVKPILNDQNQQSLIALACIFPLRFSCFSTAVALHATAVSAAGPKELGLMFTTLALCQGIGMPVGSWIADRVSGSKKVQIIPAGLISCAAFASTAAATTQTHFLAAMAIQGLCGAFMQPAVGAFTAEVTPANVRGQAMSLQRQAGSVLSLIGPISIGLLADATSCQTAIVLTSALMASCNGIYAWKARPAVTEGHKEQ